MNTPDIRTAVERLIQLHDTCCPHNVDAISGTSPWDDAISDIRAALKANPEGESPRPDSDWVAVALVAQDMRSRGLAEQVTAEELLKLANGKRLQPGRPSPTPPATEALGEALAARPLLEKVARLENSVGTIFAEVRQLAGQAAAWLRSNPPGQPVTIEPRGCPTPGACSCVELTPPAPAPGDVALAGDQRSAESLQLAHESCRLLGTKDGDCSDSEICWLDMLPCSHYENCATIPAPQAGEGEA
jgi:hypothetical protein